MPKRVIVFTCLVFFTFYTFSFVALLQKYAPTATAQESASAAAPLLELSTVTATIDGVSQEITLPHTFTNLSPRTVVTLSANIVPPPNYSFYIETEYTPMQVYIDGALVYEYGQAGSYPAAMQDPAAAAKIVTLEAHDASSSLTTLVLTYQSPITQNHFVVEPIYFGMQNILYDMVFSEMGFSFLFSLALILLSVFLTFVTCFIIMFERHAYSLLLLGMAGIMAGFWLLCDCPITNLFVGTPTQLYLISIYAMAAFPVPLIWFAISTLQLRERTFLFVLAAVELIFTTASIYLLWSDVVKSMIRVEQAFNYLVPICMTLLALYVMYEYIRYRIISLQRFALPTVMFALFTILEVSNARYGFANLPFTFFQAGIMVFMFSMGILAGLFMRDTLTLQAESQQAALDMRMMEYQAELLKKHSNLMMDTADSLKKQRHDLRHQLTVIQELAHKEHSTPLNDYLSSVMQQIPTAPMFFCHNVTINAILSHYHALCEKEGIAFKADLTLPAHSEAVQDIDYCVIFGNLLENAVEACRYLPEGERYITLTTRMRYNTLLLTMKNSFDGQYKREHGAFRSRKRDAFGVGLASVQSIATKLGGDAQYKPVGTVFTCSVYLTV